MTEIIEQLLFFLPLFIFAALIEHIILNWCNKPDNVKYRRGELLYSLISIIMQKLALEWLGILALSRTIFATVHIKDITFSWIGRLLIVDLCYYWFHRCGHVFRPLYNAHYIHHTPRQYNLSAGMRIGVVQGLYQWLFYIPAAFIISPDDLQFAMLVHNIYGLLCHTCLLEIFNWQNILVTPRYHAMHHLWNGTRCNYAGIFTIYDKIFGTYTKSKTPFNESDIYGFGLHDISINNPLRILQIDTWFNLNIFPSISKYTRSHLYGMFDTRE
jgi:sterol desaturase/sphingolipid hydroxylase (fatty acid hydroxylase superfamily)